MNLSLVLTTAAHIPERAAALAVLKTRLTLDKWAAVHEETERAPNWQWSAWVWEWVAAQSTVGSVILQEDIDIAPDFEGLIESIVSCKPDQLIGLHCAHPGARRAYLDGYRWAATRDGLIGVGYYLPTALARDMCEWRRTALRERSYERISEDCLVDVYAMYKGLRIYHPLPSPVRHKVDMKSTYNNDEHLLRMTQVTWQDATVLGHGAATFATSGVAWLGEFYQALPHHMLDLLQDRDEAKRLIKLAHGGERAEDKFRRFFGQVRGAT